MVDRVGVHGHQVEELEREVLARDLDEVLDQKVRQLGRHRRGMELHVAPEEVQGRRSRVVQVRVAEHYGLDPLRLHVHGKAGDLRRHRAVVQQDLAVFVRHQESGAADLPGGSQHLNFQVIVNS